MSLLNSPSRITVTPTDISSPTTLQYTDLTAMAGRLHPSCWRDAVWVISATVLPALLGLKFDDAADSPVPVFVQSSGGAAASMPGTLFGKPVFISEHLKALGLEGDIILASPGAYGIGLRLGMTLDKSQHIFFDSDETAFRMIIRLAGQPLWPSVITPRGGGDTLSWCITLCPR